MSTNHMSSTPTHHASNNLVKIQSPVAVFETASLNSLINIPLKYCTSRVKVPSTSRPTLLLLSPVTRDIIKTQHAYFARLLLADFIKCVSDDVNTSGWLLFARGKSQSGVRSITAIICGTIYAGRMMFTSMVPI